MVIIELHSPKYEPHTREVSRELVAVIEVDPATGARVAQGDPEWIHIVEIVVNHPHTKEDLTFDEDPELWAMTVPQAFRSDVIAESRRVPPATGEQAVSTRSLTEPRSAMSRY